nr:GNAT family N-acetyltransferase [Streptomyces sp. BK022]
MAAGLPGDGGACELRSVWVSLQARGRSVGDQLLAAVEGWTRQRGAATLKLAVLPGNVPAIALYHRIPLHEDCYPTGKRTVTVDPCSACHTSPHRPSRFTASPISQRTAEGRAELPRRFPGWG